MGRNIHLPPPLFLKKNPDLKEAYLSSKIPTKDLNSPCLPICMNQRICHMQRCLGTFKNLHTQ